MAEDKYIAGFAKLHGEDFQYYMQRYSIILGRNSKKSSVDLDLAGLGGGMNISRQHAKISYSFERRQFELQVLGKNGAYINGQVCNGGGPPVKLHSQDCIRLGDKSFYFLLGKRREPPPPHPPPHRRHPGGPDHHRTERSGGPARRRGPLKKKLSQPQEQHQHHQHEEDPLPIRRGEEEEPPNGRVSGANGHSNGLGLDLNDSPSPSHAPPPFKRARPMRSSSPGESDYDRDDRRFQSDSS